MEKIIKKLVKDKLYTQRELSNILGVGEATISLIISDLRTVSPKNQLRFRAMLLPFLERKLFFLQEYVLSCKIKKEISNLILGLSPKIEKITDRVLKIKGSDFFINVKNDGIEISRKAKTIESLMFSEYEKIKKYII